MENHDFHQICMSCMNKYVGIKTSDGKMYDGFIAHVDKDYVTLAVPTNEMMDRMYGMPANMATYRQFGFFPGFFPRRRFVPFRFPLAGIASLFLLPFFI